MVKPAPDCFNPELLARHQETLSVAFPLSRCKRLVELLASDSGQLLGQITVKKNGSLTIIAGRYSVEFELECQRCLHIYKEPVSAQFELVPVADQAAADALPEELDPLIVGEDGMLHIVDIFEDELILQLPTVPRHPTVEQCTFDFAVEIQSAASEFDGDIDGDIDGEIDAKIDRERDGEKDQQAAQKVNGEAEHPTGSAAKPGMQRGSDIFAELKNLRFDKTQH